MPGGDDEVLRLLIVDQPRLRARVRAAVGDPHLTEDILQEIAVVVLRSKDAFTPGTSFTAWVNEIQRRITLAACRRRGRQQVRMGDQELDEIAAEVRDPVAWDRERDALDHCLDQLPEGTRTALALRYGEDLATEDLARRLGRSVDGVKSLLKRVRAQIAACIDRRLDEMDGVRP